MEFQKGVWGGGQYTPFLTPPILKALGTILIWPGQSLVPVSIDHDTRTSGIRPFQNFTGGEKMESPFFGLFLSVNNFMQGTRNVKLVIIAIIGKLARTIIGHFLMFFSFLVAYFKTKRQKWNMQINSTFDSKNKDLKMTQRGWK